MLLKKSHLMQKYRINRSTFDAYVDRLPEPLKKVLDINGKRYYTEPQLTIIRQYFGDWTKYSFKTKNELCQCYGISSVTFRKILKENFEAHSDIFSNAKLFTARQVEMIEQAIGEP